MRGLKRIFSLMMVVFICITFICASFLLNVNAESTAIDVNKMAAALNKLNILQGNGGDYKLNNTMTRAEGVALIIRLMGKEKYIKENAGQYNATNYTDVSVSSWYAPYIGYSTGLNIMAGYKSGKFEPNTIMTEKQFLKITLCALGYVYTEDFSWSNVYEMAFRIGLVTDSSYETRTQDNESYKRSSAVNVIYNAFNTIKKGGTTKSVYALTDEGLFTAESIKTSGILKDVSGTEIDIVSTPDLNKILVNLNKKVQPVTASRVLIYETANKANTLTITKATTADDKVELEVSKQIPGKDYTIEITGVADLNGNVSSVISNKFKGYIPQEIKSDFFKISKVESVSNNIINVYFTHPLNTNSETPAYYEITRDGNTYVSGSSTNLSVSKLQSADNAVSLLLLNTTLAQNEVFGVKVSGRLTSGYGVKLGDGAGGTYNFVASGAQAEQFNVTAVQAWSSNTLRVVFNREPDAGLAGRAVNYSVYGPNSTVIAVTKAVVGGEGANKGKVVMLSLQAPLDKTKQYDLQIEYIMDIFRQLSTAIDTKRFPFSGIYPENSGLGITLAASDNKNSVVLVFNNALDAETAIIKSNYTIRGINDGSFNVTPEKVYYGVQYGQYVVKLYLPSERTFDSSQKYRVAISGLKDATGLLQLPLLQQDFTGGSGSVMKPEMVDAVTISKDAVKVLFNVDIAPDLNNLSPKNYKLEYVENGETLKMWPIGVTYADNQTLILRFDELNPSTAYTLSFDIVDDYSGVYSRTSVDRGNTRAVRTGQ